MKIQINQKNLIKKEKKRIQSIVGKFLYYGQAVETPILVTLNEIGIQQSEPKRNTEKETMWLMDFLTWHPNATIRYYAGKMQSAVDSNAAYLVAPGAESIFAGNFYMERPNGSSPLDMSMSWFKLTNQSD